MSQTDQAIHNRFYALGVTQVAPLTDEAVAVTFDVPAHLVETFRYLPGQHVTLRAMIDNQDVRRSYSICSNANQAKLRVGIKRLNGGAFSTWATTRLRAGDTIDVMPPVGEFTIRPDPGKSSHYAAIAAGSGITPILSLVSTTLGSEPRSRWTLVYGNRDAASVMFGEEISGLKDRYPDRLSVIWILSREDTGNPLFNGRITAGKLQQLFSRLVKPASIDEWFLCGPYQMVQDAHQALTEARVPPALVHDELFFAGPADPTAAPPPPPDDEPGAVTLTLNLEGRATTLRMRKETAILDAALSARPELPFSCKGGMCASCKARLVEGEVTMDKNWALVAEDLDAGYILTCQAHPITDSITVDYDQR